MDTVEVALEAVQPGVAGVGMAEGKRVLVGALDPCGECEVCRRGGAPVCPHAVRRDFAGARVTAARRWLVELGDGLDILGPAAAAVAGDVAIAYTLYARANVGPRDPVVVTGGGSIARFLVDVLRGKGIAPVVVAELDDAWRDELVAKGVAVAGPTREAIAVALAGRDGAVTRPLRILAAPPSPARSRSRWPARARRSPRTPAARRRGRRTRSPMRSGSEVAIVGVAGAHPELVLEAAAMVVRGEVDLRPGARVSGNFYCEGLRL